MVVKFASRKSNMEKKHDKCKGVEPHKTFIDHGQTIGTIYDFFCKTHDVLLCRCGWEWGYHRGTKNA